MSEYKFVQWGKGVPVDYQRLGQMASNEQYLKDEIDPAPKGILLWKQFSNLSFTASGVWQNLGASVSALPFDVSENRLLSVEINSGVVSTSNIACNIRFGFVVDGTLYSDIGGTSISATNLTETAVARRIFTGLTKGSHILTLQVVADTGAVVSVGGLNSTASLVVRDEGRFIGPS